MRVPKRTLCLLIAFVLLVLLISVVAQPALADLPTNPLDGQIAQGQVKAAWKRAREAGSYRFVSDIEQTLIPRPLPEMIGEQETRVDMRLDGEAQLLDRVYMEMRIEWGGSQATPLILLRDGQRTFIKEGGQLKMVEDPLGTAMPTADFLGYLVAVERVRLVEEVPLGAGVLRHYAFDLNGPRFAEYVREYMEDELKAGGDMPANVNLAPNEALQQLSGRGELWVREDGLPARQLIELDIPHINASYDAHLRILLDFRDYGCADRLPIPVQRDDGSWALEPATVPPAASLGTERLSGGGASSDTGGVSSALLRISPFSLALFLGVLFATLLFGTYRRQPRRTYTAMAVAMIVLMVSGPPLQALQVVRFTERQALAATRREANESTLARALGYAVPDEQPGAAPDDRRLDVAGVSQPRPASRSLVNTRRTLQGSPDEDSDGDGLDDQFEEYLGTNPHATDTDRDGLSDKLEVEGFSYAGRTWTSNLLP